jgi:hypothetical protein
MRLDWVRHLSVISADHQDGSLSINGFPL